MKVLGKNKSRVCYSLTQRQGAGTRAQDLRHDLAVTSVNQPQLELITLCSFNIGYLPSPILS